MAQENKDKLREINNAPDTNRIAKAAQNVPGEAVAVSHEKHEPDELGGGKRCYRVRVNRELLSHLCRFIRHPRNLLA